MTKTTVQASVLAAVLLFVTGTVPSAGAARAAAPPPPRLGPEHQISTDVIEDEEWFHPDVVYNTHRKLYFVVAHNDIDTGPSIHGQHVFLSGGLADWNWTLYGPFEGIDAIQPAVAYNSFDRDYLVVWMGRNSSQGEAYEIWGRIWDEMGLVASPAFKIYSWPNRSFWSPRVAYNAYRNEYFVVWNAYDTSGGFPGVPNDIAGCRIAAGGSIIDCGIIITWGDSPHQVDIAYNLPRNEYFVVWVRAYPADETGDDVYGAMVNWNGVVLPPLGVFAIDSRLSDQSEPAVAVDAAGHYMVVWEHRYSPGDRDIYGQEFDGTGGTVGSQLVIKSSGLDETRPAITDAPGSHEWLAAWQTSTAGGSAIWAKRWGPSAAYTLEVLDREDWEGDNPVVATGDTTFLIAYESDDVTTACIRRQINGRVLGISAVYVPLAMRNS